MGKKNKLIKRDLPSLRKRLNKTRIENDNKDESISSEEEKPKKVQTLNQTMYDEDLLKKHNSILGLGEKDIAALKKHPLRNRRNINNLTLTKRQKRKLLRQEKKEKFALMEKNTKLNLSMAPHHVDKSLMNLTTKRIQKERREKPKNFNLNEINSEMNNILTDITKETSDTKVKKNKRNKNYLLLQHQKGRIESMFNSSTFNSNPIEMAKVQIQNTQIAKERAEKLKEHFDKNYNLLKLK